MTINFFIRKLIFSTSCSDGIEIRRKLKILITKHENPGCFSVSFFRFLLPLLPHLCFSRRPAKKHFIVVVGIWFVISISHSFPRHRNCSWFSLYCNDTRLCCGKVTFTASHGVVLVSCVKSPLTGIIRVFVVAFCLAHSCVAFASHRYVIIAFLSKRNLQFFN